ncbi:MAG: hydroxylase [Acidobacteriota bacterium]
MKIHYLELVTHDVDGVCDTWSRLHGLTFGEPVPEFGGARTAARPDGSLVGVRGPLRDDEQPVVRPYVLVEDIDAAVQSAADGGAEVAMPPMEIPGRGRFAILIVGGNDLGLWQL